MSLHHLPNLISLLRIVLALPVWYYLHEQQYDIALAIFIVAGFSDILDGYLARHAGWTSRLGSLLDPIGDKVLVTTVFFTLAWQGELPLWLALLVIGRDIVIVAGAAAYQLLIGDCKMEPTLLSKANTAIQMGFAAFLLTMLNGYLAIPILHTLALWATAIAAVASGINYVWAWSERAINARRQQRRSPNDT